MRRSQFYILFLLMLLAFNVGAQSPKNEVDAIGVDSIAKKESVTPIDTTQKSRIRRVKVDLDNQVVFSSQDSIVMTGENRVYMYGKGAVTYGKLKLDADQIDMDKDEEWKNFLDDDKDEDDDLEDEEIKSLDQIAKEEADEFFDDEEEEEDIVYHNDVDDFEIPEVDQSDFEDYDEEEEDEEEDF